MIFRIIVIIGSLLLLLACTNNNYAPVRNYYRDIPKIQKYYVVEQGDTLYSIGFRSGYGYKRLAKWNNIFPPYRLLIGQKIKLFYNKQKHRFTFTKNSQKTKIKKTRSRSQKFPIISNNNKKVLKLHWQWPIYGKVLKSFFQTGNKGIDISSKPGQAVKAAAAGKVVYSGRGLVGYGNLLIIKHNPEFLSAYANNRSVRVKEGQIVKIGQIIAEVGKTRGEKTALHFEIRKKGKPVNPIKFLPKK